MTTERLNVIIDGSQGALLRVLGTVERRGWQVRAVESERLGRDSMLLRLEVLRLPWHGASADVLRRHLAKLVCVSSVDEATTFHLAGVPESTAETAVVMGVAS